MPTAHQRTSNRKITGVVPSSDQQDFDCIPFDSFDGVKYIIKVYNQTENRFQLVEMTGTKKDADVSDQISSRHRGPLQVSLNLVKVATDVCLRIVNSETFAVNVSILKIDF